MSEERPVRKCATPEMHERLQQLPEYQARQLQLEAFTNRFIAVAGTLRQVGAFQIPVVVHVVYNAVAENISDEQVRSEIDVLNRDYAAMNADRAHVPPPWLGIVGNAGVQFALATADPSGGST